jgi:hypothetical protein
MRKDDDEETNDLHARSGDGRPSAQEDHAPAIAVTPTSARNERPRYAIQVTYGSGAVAYLRHGATVGDGAIVQFRDRKTADVNLDFISEGLDDGATAAVVRYRTDLDV